MENGHFEGIVDTEYDQANVGSDPRLPLEGRKDGTLKAFSVSRSTTPSLKSAHARGASVSFVRHPIRPVISGVAIGFKTGHFCVVYMQ